MSSNLTTGVTASLGEIFVVLYVTLASFVILNGFNTIKFQIRSTKEKQVLVMIHVVVEIYLGRWLTIKVWEKCIAALVVTFESTKINMVTVAFTFSCRCCRIFSPVGLELHTKLRTKCKVSKYMKDS